MARFDPSTAEYLTSSYPETFGYASIIGEPLPHEIDDTGYYGDDDTALFGGLKKLTKKVAKGISTVAKTTQKAVGTVTNNPVWSIAQTGASFIPGVGTAVSSGMAAAAAVGKGKSLSDIGLAAARGALPGGPAAAAAFDVAVGLAKGKSLTSAALDAARAQVPGGAMGKAAFDAGLMLAKGKAPTTAMVAAAASQIPGLKERAALVKSVTDGIRHRRIPQGLFTVPGLEPAADRLVGAMQLVPSVRQKTLGELMRDHGVSGVGAKQAIAGVVNRFAGRPAIQWRDVGAFDSLDTAAVTAGVTLPESLRPALLGVGPSGPPPMQRRVPRIRVTRNGLHRLFARGNDNVRRGLQVHGHFARTARDAGELTGDAGWIIRSGDTASAISLKLTGTSSRWKELLTANPSLSTYTDAKGATQIKPWNIGQRIDVPSSWLGGGTIGGVTVPSVLSTSTTPVTTISSSSASSTSGGPPFPAPSEYPQGYPSGTYVVKDGDYGTKIAERITGSGSRWKELLAANPSHADPQYGMAMYAGDVLQLPPSWVAAGSSTSAGSSSSTSAGSSASTVLTQVANVLTGGSSTSAGSTSAGSSGAPIVGTTQQVSLIQAQLAVFANEHREASSLSPVFGQTAEDMSGQWTDRTRAQMESFQQWANLRGHGPLPEDGLPDEKSVVVLSKVNAGQLTSAGSSAGSSSSTSAGSSTGLGPLFTQVSNVLTGGDGSSGSTSAGGEQATQVLGQLGQAATQVLSGGSSSSGSTSAGGEQATQVLGQLGQAATQVLSGGGSLPVPTGGGSLPVPTGGSSSGGGEALILGGLAAALALL